VFVTHVTADAHPTRALPLARSLHGHTRARAHSDGHSRQARSHATERSAALALCSERRIGAEGGRGKRTHCKRTARVDR
jgi:hypothetical protein